MAKLSRDDVFKLARLARLELSEEEAERFRTDIGQTLELVEKLQSADLDGEKPTIEMSELHDVTRSDKVRDYGVTSKDLLRNAPATEKGYIKVKRMLS